MTTNGQAAFTYTDTATVPGTDTLTASAQSGVTPVTASATITWGTPASTPRATLSALNGSSPSLFLAVAYTGGGAPSGYLLRQAGSESLLAPHLTALVASGQDATLFGTATLPSGQRVSFRIDAVAGTRGTVRLVLSNGYDSGAVRVARVAIKP